MSGAPYGEYQKMRDRAERAEEQYEGAKSEITKLNESCYRRELRVQAAEDGERRLREQLQTVEKERDYFRDRLPDFSAVQQAEFARAISPTQKVVEPEVCGVVERLANVAAVLREQLDAAQRALWGNGHRPPGTPSFHMDGCSGCAALAGDTDLVKEG